ncbi:hypothetical protein TNCV_4216041 [Trichonephila clavipes]|nr:hypothetical protein TNCV_4216041 [Trichonephila clavipes]
MSRFGGLSEERPSVFKTRSKLGTHLSNQCSGDERQSRPCPAHNMLTKSQMIKFIDFCEVWFLPESVARVAAVAGDHCGHTPRH